MRRLLLPLLWVTWHDAQRTENAVVPTWPVTKDRWLTRGQWLTY